MRAKAEVLDDNVPEREVGCLTKFELSDEPCQINDELVYACVFADPNAIGSSSGYFSRKDIYIYGERLCVNGEEEFLRTVEFTRATIDTCDGLGFGRVGMSGEDLRSGAVAPPPVEAWFD